MAISRLNTLLAIMLAALVWGCGRSSSNDQNSSTEVLPADEAIESIHDAEIDFDECSLNEYAHIISRHDDVDTEQLCYMLKQCQATAHHLQHQLSAINDNELPDSVLAAVEAITQQEWFADFNYVTTYLYSAALPEQFADLLKDLQETSRLNDSEIARLRQQ